MWNEPNEPPQAGSGDPRRSYDQRQRGVRRQDQEYPGAAELPTRGTLGGGQSTGNTYPYPYVYPQQPPEPSAYPDSPVPAWPRPQYDQRPRAPRYSPETPAQYGTSARPHPYDDPMYAQARPVERRQRAHTPVSLPHLPIAHVFLIAGIAAMAIAIGQPWGTDASGTTLYVHDFANARLAQHGIDAGALAVRTAAGIVIAAAVLGAALILLNSVVTVLNHILGIVGLSGCASLVFFPVLWGGATLLFLVLLAAAGFAGLGAFSNLPIVQGHGFSLADVRQNGLGFYLWAGGIAAAFLGMLGQLMLRRR